MFVVFPALKSYRRSAAVLAALRREEEDGKQSLGRDHVVAQASATSKCSSVSFSHGVFLAQFWSTCCRWKFSELDCVCLVRPRAECARPLSCGRMSRSHVVVDESSAQGKGRRTTFGDRSIFVLVFFVSRRPLWFFSALLAWQSGGV